MGGHVSARAIGGKPARPCGGAYRRERHSRGRRLGRAVPPQRDGARRRRGARGRAHRAARAIRQSRPRAGRLHRADREPAGDLAGHARAGGRLRAALHRRGRRRVPPRHQCRARADLRDRHPLLRHQGPGVAQLRADRDALCRGHRPRGPLRAAQAAAPAAGLRRLHAPGGGGGAPASRGRPGQRAAQRAVPRAHRDRRVPGRCRVPARGDRRRAGARRARRRDQRGPRVGRGHRGGARLPRAEAGPVAAAFLGTGEDRHRPVPGARAARRRGTAHQRPRGRRAAAAVRGPCRPVRSPPGPQGPVRQGRGRLRAAPARPGDADDRD